MVEMMLMIAFAAAKSVLHVPAFEAVSTSFHALAGAANKLAASTPAEISQKRMILSSLRILMILFATSCGWKFENYRRGLVDDLFTRKSHHAICVFCKATSVILRCKTLSELP